MSTNDRINEVNNQLKRISGEMFDRDDALMGSVVWAFTRRIDGARNGTGGETVAKVIAEMRRFVDGMDDSDGDAVLRLSFRSCVEDLEQA